jgi:trans-2,3-dihydro-3-hydroxyanthranilate isomerase
MFAPGLGVPEDPATGSAAGALGAYLVRRGGAATRDGVARFVFEQGVEIGRPSRIEVRVTVDDRGDVTGVYVGGSAIRVITGDVML